jgi:hypothetical protein
LYERGHAHHNTTNQPTDSAHDINQYRLERRDIVGIASLLTGFTFATGSIPLAGRRLRRRARIFRQTSVSRHERATRIRSIKATIGIISTVTTKWRTED